MIGMDNESSGSLFFQRHLIIIYIYMYIYNFSNMIAIIDIVIYRNDEQIILSKYNRIKSNKISIEICKLFMDSNFNFQITFDLKEMNV